MKGKINHADLVMLAGLAEDWPWMEVSMEYTSSNLKGMLWAYTLWL